MGLDAQGISDDARDDLGLVDVLHVCHAGIRRIRGRSGRGMVRGHDGGRGFDGVFDPPLPVCSLCGDGACVLCTAPADYACTSACGCRPTQDAAGPTSEGGGAPGPCILRARPAIATQSHDDRQERWNPEHRRGTIHARKCSGSTRRLRSHRISVRACSQASRRNHARITPGSRHLRGPGTETPCADEHDARHMRWMQCLTRGAGHPSGPLALSPVRPLRVDRLKGRIL